jgi:AcrR family transcriptional regulator
VIRLARTAGQGEKTKKQIAQKAKKLFEQKGYAATTMEEIHSETGYSKGSIYYHFKSKEDLFLYILEDSTEQWKKKWDEISSPLTTATEKLYKLTEHYVQDLQTPLIKTAIEFISSEVSDPTVQDKLINWVKADHIVFRQILEEGMRNGEFKEAPLDDLTLIVYGMHNGLSMNHHDQNTEVLHRLYHMGIDVLLKGIAR